MTVAHDIYTEAERLAALQYLRGRRSLRAAWKVENHLRSEQYIVEVPSLISLSRVMRILRHLFMPAEATDRRVQKQHWCGKCGGRGVAEFTTAGFWNDASNVASIR